MRGKATLQDTSITFDRITPAYAGKGNVTRQKSRPMRDHPRVCGERTRVCGEAAAKTGSPPRMRGKDTLTAEDVQQIGITPAYAGKGPSCPSKSTVLKDHPRVCGERNISSYGRVRWEGSPPRMRGKGRACRQTRRLSGITPAYAGKGHFKPAVTAFWKDHPRVCGER